VAKRKKGAVVASDDLDEMLRPAEDSEESFDAGEDISIRLELNRMKLSKMRADDEELDEEEFIRLSEETKMLEKKKRLRQLEKERQRIEDDDEDNSISFGIGLL